MCQAAFANRKYTFSQVVGLPSNIIASLATEDTVKSSQMLIFCIYTLVQ